MAIAVRSTKQATNHAETFLLEQQVLFEPSALTTSDVGWVLPSDSLLPVRFD